MNKTELQERVEQLDDQVNLLSGLLDSAIREKIMTYEVLDHYLDRMEKFLETRQSQTIDVLKTKIRELEDEREE